VEIIGFGAGNYNTAQEVQLFREKGLKYRPDKVVVFFFINDAEPTPHMSSWGILNHSRAITFLWSRANILRSRFSAARGFQSYYSSLYQEGQPGWEQQKRAFLDLKDLCARNGTHLQVVLLPELHAPSRLPFKAEHEKVMAFLSDHGIESLDVAPAFLNQPDPHRLWVALDDAHPNRIAHRLIAEATLEFLSRKTTGAKTYAANY
jgi:hypothetical protein